MSGILTHGQIWAAIDSLGERYGMTPSGLAKKAGLDPTTFNRSKRATASGRQRWPSTESIAKVLQATGASLDEFMALVSDVGPGAPWRTRPLIALEKAAGDGFFDDAGFATGRGWDEIDLLADADSHSYALEIAGESMEPLYRPGDIVIVSPTAPVRRGDRVVVKTRFGEVIPAELKRLTARTVELHPINPAFPDRVLAREDVNWIARILWASQ